MHAEVPHRQRQHDVGRDAQPLGLGEDDEIAAVGRGRDDRRRSEVGEEPSDERRHRADLRRREAGLRPIVGVDAVAGVSEQHGRTLRARSVLPYRPHRAGLEGQNGCQPVVCVVVAVTTVTGSLNLRSTRCGRSWCNQRYRLVGSVEMMISSM